MTKPLVIDTAVAKAYTVPTDLPEADGTFSWNSTTLIVIELQAGETHGLGYSYAHAVTAPLARELFEHAVLGKDPLDISSIHADIRRQQRNYGAEGIGATTLSAIDVALWDLKAKLLNQPLCKLLGQVRESAPVYGSGGFTNYTETQLAEQFHSWQVQGITQFKMKVGTNPESDLVRVKSARNAIGFDAQLFVDANGAYSRKQAMQFAREFAEYCGVTWFEEPVSSDDLIDLRAIRETAPPQMEIAAGEYGWTSQILQRMITAEAIDVLQADATRCGGITGFMNVAAIAEASSIPLSAHCAPTLHLHLACAAKALRHVEYFHDHVRIEQMLFDGFHPATGGVMYPDLSRPGLGIEFKQSDAEPYRNDL